MNSTTSSTTLATAAIAASKILLQRGDRRKHTCMNTCMGAGHAKVAKGVDPCQLNSNHSTSDLRRLDRLLPPIHLLAQPSASPQPPDGTCTCSAIPM